MWVSQITGVFWTLDLRRMTQCVSLGKDLCGKGDSLVARLLRTEYLQNAVYMARLEMEGMGDEVKTGYHLDPGPTWQKCKFLL